MHKAMQKYRERGRDMRNKLISAAVATLICKLGGIDIMQVAGFVVVTFCVYATVEDVKEIFGGKKSDLDRKRNTTGK